MKNLVLAAWPAFFALSAPANTVIEEKIVATFSTYDRLDEVLTCLPGYSGHYPTPDVLILKNFTVGVGLPLGEEEFTAFSNLAVIKEIPSIDPSGLRPYEVGCKPAIEQIRNAIAGLQRVDLKVTRRLSTRRASTAKVERKLNGEVLSVRRIRHETHSEFYTFELAGFSFSLYRSISGPGNAI